MAIVLIAFVLISAVLRFIVLPHIPDYRPQIETEASQLLGIKVHIGQIDSYWSGFNPGFDVHNILLGDRGQQHTPLHIGSAHIELSWWGSILRGKPIFNLVSINTVKLVAHRNIAGDLFVAGLPVSAEGDKEPGALDWLLKQERIRIQNASLLWRDDFRAAPVLELHHVRLSLDNIGRRHRFKIDATPSAALAEPFSIQGDVRGSSFAQLKDWKGLAYTELKVSDLSAWSAWFDYPAYLPAGKGEIRFWAHANQLRQRLIVDSILRNTQLKLGQSIPMLNLRHLQGRVVLTHRAKYQKRNLLKMNATKKILGRTWQLQAQDLMLETQDGLQLPETSLEAYWEQSENTDDSQYAGYATVESLSLDKLKQLAAYMPLDKKNHGLLSSYSPAGDLKQLTMRWQYANQSLNTYRIKTDFENIGINANGTIPGFSGLSGQIEVNKSGGVLKLNSKNVNLDFPGVFPEPQLSFAKLAVDSRWKIDWSQYSKTEDNAHNKKQSPKIHIDISSIEFENDDTKGRLQGSYKRTDSGANYVDLSGELNRAKASSVWRYLPHSVGEKTRLWLRRAITTGSLKEATFKLKGDLSDFPFKDNEKGQFLVSATTQGVDLNYAPSWPKIEAIDGALKFEGSGLSIKIDSARTLDANIHHTTAQIPKLGKNTKLKIQGEASGRNATFLKFISSSPITKWINRATEPMVANGQGKLKIALDLPLNHMKKALVNGTYNIQSDEFVVMPGLPTFHNVVGNLAFDEKSFKVDQVKGHFLGAPAVLNAATDANGGVRLGLQGRATAQALQEYLNWPMLKGIQGMTDWRANAIFKSGGYSLNITSNLEGINSNLPAPLDKSSDTRLDMRYLQTGLPQGKSEIVFNFGENINGKLIRSSDKTNGVQIKKGFIKVGTGPAPKLPKKGLKIYAAAEKINGDQWLGVFKNPAYSQDAGRQSIPTERSDSSLPPESFIELNTPKLLFKGLEFNQTRLKLRPQENSWHVSLNSKQAKGELLWSDRANGKLSGHMQYLQLKHLKQEDQSEQPEMIQELPGVDLTIDEFLIGKRQIGTVVVNAENDAGFWQVKKLRIDNPDVKLDAKGVWQSQGEGVTYMEVKMDSKNTGGLLDRLQYKNLMRQGETKIEAQLWWQGIPIKIDFPSLTGNFSLASENGRFRKIKPGLGKLLGLLSLQAIPRRIAFDYRDIFRSGFAYNELNSKFEIKQGVMRIVDQLKLFGPAGQIEMKGEVNLEHETQQLTVSIQPELGVLAALGAGLANPAAGLVVGVGTLIGSKLLKNPINRLFQKDYEVTGTWDNLDVSAMESDKIPDGEESGG